MNPPPPDSSSAPDGVAPPPPLEALFPRRGRPLARPLELMFSLPAASLAARPDWLDQVLDYPAAGLPRWVQVHHGHLFELSSLARWAPPGHRADEAKRTWLREVIARCHRRDVRVAWMVGKLNPPPGLLAAHPALANLHSGAWWALVEETVGEILDALPDLDEFSLYLFESPPLLDAHHFFAPFHHGADAEAWPYLAPADLIRELLHACARACRRAGRSFSLLTHVWYPHQEELLAAALRDWPADLPLLLEHNYSTGDFNPHLPENALLHRAPHLRHGLLFCGGLEYGGLAEIPCCHPELMQARVTSALEHTPHLERICFRPIWEDRSLFGTANEINLAAAVAFARQPWRDVDEVWLEWAGPQAGAAAPELARVLREVTAAAQSVFFQHGTRTNDHSRLPSFDYLRTRAVNYAKALAIWRPDPETRQAVWEFIVAPGARQLRLNEEIHAAATATVQRARATLAALPLNLLTSAGTPLVAGLDVLLAWIRVHRWQIEVFLRWRQFALSRQPEARLAGVSALRSLADAVAGATPPTAPASALLDPARLHAFVARARAEFDRA